MPSCEGAVPKIKQEEKTKATSLPVLKPSFVKMDEGKKNDTKPSSIHIDLSHLDISDEVCIVESSPGEVNNQDCIIASPPVAKNLNDQTFLHFPFLFISSNMIILFSLCMTHEVKKQPILYWSL